VAIIRSISALGTNLGIRTTAEGVETAEQLACVRRLQRGSGLSVQSGKGGSRIVIADRSDRRQKPKGRLSFCRKVASIFLSMISGQTPCVLSRAKTYPLFRIML
jgi:predicted signal transduction protein with EAL and GGDEF domain